jgi:isopenicillin N synthase-like dioxygenase
MSPARLAEAQRNGSSGGFMTSTHAKTVDSATLPIIDITALRCGDAAARRDVARRIRAACVESGFFYISGHGVPDELLAGIIAAARRFFAQPLADKLVIDVAKSFCYRGYEPLKAQTLEAGMPPDLKEGFSIDRDLPLDDPDVVARRFGCGPNQWPPNLPGWRETLEAYQRAMNDLGETMARGLALSLDLPDDAFAAFCTDASGIVRLVHYPPQPANPLPGEKGCGAHTDWGAFTLLLQDDAGGLEVWDQAEGWIEAVPIAGTFVVNVGDMMARWTNDRYRSTQHRVVNRSGRDRISVPFFYMGRLDHEVACLPGCSSEDEPAKYPPTTPAEHLAMMAQRTYGN